MRLVVTGGRDFNDEKTIFKVLDSISEEKLIKEIIVGRAKGVDEIAEKWANENKIKILAFPANWGKHGKAAGFIRNIEMLEKGKPDIAVAFPGGVGTRHMVAEINKRNIPVYQVERPAVSSNFNSL